MGAQTIKPLAPTLALLNVRLGYWLRNPNRVTRREPRNKLANFYFLAEMFGLLNENRKSVYLTDGGHIDNLGIYELLRRRCKVIIVSDAEADPEMAFGSLNNTERYARIDLGTRIDLPWQEITNMSLNTSKSIDETGDCPKNDGPHCAVGKIEYPDNQRGVLVYIKSSLSGDENDYIFHYKKRFSAFPHETTLDQFFSEEQFEVYRALGFHAAYGLLRRWDKFAHRDPAECPQVTDQMRLLDRLFPVAMVGSARSFADRVRNNLPCEFRRLQRAVKKGKRSSRARERKNVVTKVREPAPEHQFTRRPMADATTSNRIAGLARLQLTPGPDHKLAPVS